MREFFFIVLRICGATISIFFLLAISSPEFSLAFNQDALFSSTFYLKGGFFFIGEMLGLLLWGYSHDQLKKIRNK